MSYPKRRNILVRSREASENTVHFFRLLKNMPVSNWPAWMKAAWSNFQVRQDIRHRRKWLSGLMHMGFTREAAEHMIVEIKDYMRGERYGDWRDSFYRAFELGGFNRAAIKQVWSERRGIARSHMDARSKSQRTGYRVTRVIGRDGQPKYRWIKHPLKRKKS